MLKTRKISALLLGAVVLCLSFVVTARPAQAAGTPYAKVTLRYYYDFGFGPQSGVINVEHSNEEGTNAGYDFVNEENTSYTDGAFYIGTQNGKLLFFGNNEGQGGVYRMKGMNWKMPAESEGLYTKFGVEVKRGGVYAIYDETNDEYIKVRVLKITRLPAPVVRSTSRSASSALLPSVSTDIAIGSSVTAPIPAVQTVTPASLLARPVITYPDQYQVVPKRSDTLSIRWTPVSGAASYSVEIEFDHCCSATAPEWSGQSKGYFNNITTPSYDGIRLVAPGHTYRLRVQALDASGNRSDWSEYRYFYYDNPPDVASQPPASTVVVPVAGPAGIVVPTGLSAMVTVSNNAILNWNYPSGTKTFDMELDCDGCKIAGSWSPMDYERITAAPGTTDNSYAYKVYSLVPGITYRVRLRAVTDSGASSAWTDYAYFLAPKPAAGISKEMVAPRLSTPENSAVVVSDSPSVNLEWTAVGGAVKYTIMLDYFDLNKESWGEYRYYNTFDAGVATTAPLGTTGRYRVRLRATYQDDSVGPTSNYYYFNYQKPSPASSPIR